METDVRCIYVRFAVTFLTLLASVNFLLDIRRGTELALTILEVAIKRQSHGIGHMGARIAVPLILPKHSMSIDRIEAPVSNVSFYLY